MTKNNRYAGFHLIEILIALALTAIISQWLLGHYQNFIADERRREAEQALYALASALEEYAMANATYAGATLQNLRVQAIIANNTYELTINSAQQNDYLVSARPLRDQAKIDSRCGKLLLTSAGEKRSTGHDNTQQCW